jgi:putative transposase
MARLARLVVPGLPHHVTQRGDGRARVFFSEADYALYRDLLTAACLEARVEVWAWVLMPNHVHLILKPADTDGLRRALSRVHRQYAGAIHRRRKRTGHFWQGRFGSVVMDEDHLAAALRYVALNPVRVRLVKRAEDWRWSSVKAHLRRADDGLTTIEPALSRFPRFADLLEGDENEAATERLRRAESIGRPLGSTAFLARLEKRFARPLVAKKRGPKPAAAVRKTRRRRAGRGVKRGSKKSALSP